MTKISYLLLKCRSSIYYGLTTNFLMGCLKFNLILIIGFIMKRINHILPFLLIIFITGCSTAESQTSEIRTFTNITGVSLLGSGDVDIKIGDKEELVIHAPADLLPYLITEVKDGTLKIGKRRNGWKKYKKCNEKINYALTVKNIDHLLLSGSGNISAEKLSGEDCTVKVSGSGDIDIAMINSDKLSIHISGSGDISVVKVTSNMIGTTISGSGDVDINGKIEKCDFTISGSGNLYGAGLKCDEASIDIYGSGDSELNIKDFLKAHISGSGNVYYGGSPKIDSRISGSGKIINRNL